MPDARADPSLSRDLLERTQGVEVRSATSYRPRLVRTEIAGQPAIVKDYRPCGRFLRAFGGPWLVGREVRIYRALAGCPGVPRLLGQIDRHAFAVEYIPGRNAAEYADGALPPEFFHHLQEVVDAIHAHGVVHCDLKNRRNIIVGEGHHPYLVDFSTAFGQRGRFQFLRGYAYRRFLLDDEKAVVKARLQVGKMWDPADAEFAFRRGPGERLIRRLRDGLRWAFKLLSRG